MWDVTHIRDPAGTGDTVLIGDPMHTANPMPTGDPAGNLQARGILHTEGT